MIKFFRHIRKRFITEGKISKYLIYALGEILLVVAGILIALQINNWNQSRLDLKKEKELINALKEDLQADLITLNNAVMHISAKERFLLGILAEEDADVETIETWQSISNAGIPSIFASRMQGSISIRDHTYQEMISTGSLSIMTNESLKNEILNFYKLVNNRNKIMASLLSDWPRIVSEYIPAEGNIHSLAKKASYPSEELEVIYKTLQKNKEQLRPTINAEMQYNSRAKISYQLIIERVQLLLDIIEEIQKD